MMKSKRPSQVKEGEEVEGTVVDMILLSQQEVSRARQAVQAIEEMIDNLTNFKPEALLKTILRANTWSKRADRTLLITNIYLRTALEGSKKEEKEREEVKE